MIDVLCVWLWQQGGRLSKLSFGLGVQEVELERLHYLQLVISNLFLIIVSSAMLPSHGSLLNSP
jgi:hypothetical protein